MPDQAESLRTRMMAQEVASTSGMDARVVAVASGKGGVGKSNFCVNFALGLQMAGRHPVVIDTDVGFANVELLLGVRPKNTLMDVLGGCSIWDVLETSPSGLPFLSAGNGLMDIHSLQAAEMDKLLSELRTLAEKHDYILIDTGAGLGSNVRRLLSAANDLVVVTTPEPTAIADAYSLLKLLVSRDDLSPTRLVVNRAPSFVEAKLAADKLMSVAERFLQIGPSTLGYILEDEVVGRAVMRQQAFLSAFPNSQAARCVMQLVQNYLHSEISLPRRGLSAFLERLARRFKSGDEWDSGHSA